MGTVYRATHLALDHLVALKVISADLNADPSFRERFKSESRIAVSLRHPNVVPIHHAGEEDGLLFVTMDLIDGPDLRKLLIARGAARSRGGRLDPRPGRLGARRRPLARPRAPRHQARQRADRGARGRRRPRLPDRLRPDQAHRPGRLGGADQHRRLRRHARLRRARADPRRRPRRDAPTSTRSAASSSRCSPAAPPFSDREEKVAKMFAHLQDDRSARSAARTRSSTRSSPAPPRRTGSDRYPSAGDLARGAAAALDGRSVQTAERSVGVGPAAPTEQYQTPAEPTDRPLLDRRAARRTPDLGDTVASEPDFGDTLPSEPGPAPRTRARPSRSAPTRCRPRRRSADRRHDSGRRGAVGRRARVRRSRQIAHAAVVAVLAVIALIVGGYFALSGGGGDGDGRARPRPDSTNGGSNGGGDPARVRPRGRAGRHRRRRRCRSASPPTATTSSSSTAPAAS